MMARIILFVLWLVVMVFWFMAVKTIPSAITEAYGNGYPILKLLVDTILIFVILVVGYYDMSKKILSAIFKTDKNNV